MAAVSCGLLIVAAWSAVSDGAWAAVPAGEARLCETYWNQPGYDDPIRPTLAKAPPAAGLNGRITEELEWVTPANALGDGAPRRVWQARAWRNERVHGQFVVWTDVPRGQLRARISPLVSASGAVIPATNLLTRFVRYIPADRPKDPFVTGYGDCLDTVAEVSLPANGFRPLWVTAAVPAEAAKGLYRGTLCLTAEADGRVAFPIELEVVDRTLPNRPSFYLDLWQLPWSVARYHGVEPYSPLHYELLRPYYRELAAAGQRAATVFIVDELWPGTRGKIDDGDSMIRYTVNADGSRAFDFTLFDRHVAFARSCGVGPQIHCYSFVRFQQDRRDVQDATYFDGATGLKRVATFHGFDDPAWEAYWGPLAAAIENHAREKGWLGDVYVGIDEMNASVVRRVKSLLAKWAPNLKIQFANDKPYADFAAFDLDNFSQALRKDFMSGDLFADIARRRAKGRFTTFYVCAGHPPVPNTWVTRPAAESEWMGLYAAARGFDGMLRWAAFTWPRDPFFQTDYGPVCQGETTFLYPGCRASVRWERLRDSIESFEKIRILRASGEITPALEAALAGMRFDPKLPAGTYAASVRAVNRALDAVGSKARE